MRQRWKLQQLQFIFNPGRLATNGIITEVISCPDRDTDRGWGGLGRRRRRKAVRKRPAARSSTPTPLPVNPSARG